MTEEIRRVMINCPGTGNPVETVFRLRESAFSLLKGEFRFRCTLCGQVHAWRREDAWLETARPR